MGRVEELVDAIASGEWVDNEAEKQRLLSLLVELDPVVRKLAGARCSERLASETTPPAAKQHITKWIESCAELAARYLESLATAAPDAPSPSPVPAGATPPLPQQADVFNVDRFAGFDALLRQQQQQRQQQPLRHPTGRFD